MIKFGDSTLQVYKKVKEERKAIEREKATKNYFNQLHTNKLDNLLVTQPQYKEFSEMSYNEKTKIVDTEFCTVIEYFKKMLKCLGVKKIGATFHYSAMVEITFDPRESIYYRMGEFAKSVKPDNFDDKKDNMKVRLKFGLGPVDYCYEDKPEIVLQYIFDFSSSEVFACHRNWEMAFNEIFNMKKVPRDTEEKTIEDFM
jgi:hypothetical protein